MQNDSTTRKGGRKPGDGGRPKGIPNKATRAAREAIAMFVDGNAHRLQEWLDKVANGVPRIDSAGNPRFDEEGNPLWITPPNPEKAAQLFNNVIEYHVPKLARSEMSGVDGAPIAVAAIDMKGLSDTELAQMQQLLQKANSAL